MTCRAAPASRDTTLLAFLPRPGDFQTHEEVLGTDSLLTTSDMEGWYHHCGYQPLAQCA
jgi:hypothetical protein